MQLQREQRQMTKLLGTERRSAIVGKPEPTDMTPEEHKRLGDAADALWRELARRATGREIPNR